MLLSWVRKLELFEVTKRPPLFHIETRMIQHWINTSNTRRAKCPYKCSNERSMTSCVLGTNITAVSRIDLLHNRLNVQEKCISNNPFRLWNCYSGGPLGLPLYWTKFCLKCIVPTLLRPSPFYSQFLPTAREGNAFTLVRLFTGGGLGWPPFP